MSSGEEGNMKFAQVWHWSHPGDLAHEPSFILGKFRLVSLLNIFCYNPDSITVTGQRWRRRRYLMIYITDLNYYPEHRTKRCSWRSQQVRSYMNSCYCGTVFKNATPSTSSPIFSVLRFSLFVALKPSSLAPIGAARVNINFLVFSPLKKV